MRLWKPDPVSCHEIPQPMHSILHGRTRAPAYRTLSCSVFVPSRRCPPSTSRLAPPHPWHPPRSCAFDRCVFASSRTRLSHPTAVLLSFSRRTPAKVPREIPSRAVPRRRYVLDRPFEPARCLAERSVVRCLRIEIRLHRRPILLTALQLAGPSSMAARRAGCAAGINQTTEGRRSGARGVSMRGLYG